jgi:hypothetical protein
MNKYIRKLSLLLLFFFINLNILSINYTYSSNQEKDRLTEKILNSENKLHESINWEKYINKINQLLINIEEINNLNKIIKINLKIENYIKLFINKQDIKSKKLVLILNYLNNKINLIEYNLNIKNNLVLNKNLQYKSPYLESIKIPTCDKNNSEVQFINNNSDWSHINDINKTIFCVSPGDYSNIWNIKLTENGTDSKKRYIILNNWNNKNPWLLDISNLAKVSFILENTNYWVIDRMWYRESPNVWNPIKIKNSDYNIINRYYMKNVWNGIYIYPGSDNNTIQNSLIKRDNITIYNDRAAIGLFDNAESNIEIKNTKIINNTIINFVDWFQAIRMSTKNINYEWTIVDNNLIYINNIIYTNCKWEHDINWSCAYAENAIDIKAGSNKSNNPMIISNNTVYWFKKSDKTNSYLDDPWAAIVVHFGVNNINITNNNIYNSDVWLSVDWLIDWDYAMLNSVISNNIFSNIKAQVIRIWRSKNIILYNNLLQNMKKLADNWKYWLLEYKNQNMSIKNNKFCNLDNRTAFFWDNAKDISIYSNNVFFNTNPWNINYNNSNIIKTDTICNF